MCPRLLCRPPACTCLPLFFSASLCFAPRAHQPCGPHVSMCVNCEPTVAAQVWRRQAVSQSKGRGNTCHSLRTGSVKGVCRAGRLCRAAACATKKCTRQLSLRTECMTRKAWVVASRVSGAKGEATSAAASVDGISCGCSSRGPCTAPPLAQRGRKLVGSRPSTQHARAAQLPATQGERWTTGGNGRIAAAANAPAPHSLSQPFSAFATCEALLTQWRCSAVLTPV